MKSQVFFTDLRTTPQVNLFKKLDLLLDKLHMEEFIEPKDLVALKLHFGEKGNTAHVKPVYVRRIVDQIKNLDALPFLTDTNTLYVGSRKESVSHLQTAIENGFDYSVAGAPLIIADGLRGKSAESVEINKKWYRKVEIASEIHNADALIGVTHFKCHELSGFGGVLKNLGMGGASLRGKLDQHSNVKPFVDEEKCTGCLRCLAWCPTPGTMEKMDNKKIRIVSDTCIGCGECILPCRDGAIRIQWDADTGSMQEKMVEHVLGILQEKKGKFAFVTFVTQISPACDCYPANDTPIVGDIGILTSRDPVAIDQAAADLVNLQPGNQNTRLRANYNPGEDKFRGVYPEIDWTVQLRHGEEIGLGSRKYELITV